MNATDPAEHPPIPASENKLFRKWRREFSLITGYNIDPAERVFAINRRNCERWKNDLLNYSTWNLSLPFPCAHG
jgi:inner membrane protease ATP23